ncbi:MAG: lipoyl synthase [Thermoplasmatota archaeon]
MATAPERMSPKPRWLVRPLPKGPKVEEIRGLLREHNLHTVCEEAACPNRGECWSKGEATLMIMGDTCTRACRFCDVAAGKVGPLDPLEPAHVAFTVKTLGLTYAVVTSVDRDDLPDQGAGHWARVIRAVRAACPDTILDVLTPDFRGERECLATVAAGGAHVLAHNIETVERLQGKVRDPRAGYRQSLDVLAAFKKLAPSCFTKSGVMIGHGETRDEVVRTLEDLRAVDVDFVTIGQYLRPSSWHLPVAEYVPPAEFVELERIAYELGFTHAVAGPFVRSSYKAWETESIVRARRRGP